MECDDVSGATEGAGVDSTEDKKINETSCSLTNCAINAF